MTLGRLVFHVGDSGVLRISVIFAALLCTAAGALAKTGSDLFEAVAPSIVVVYASSSDGKDGTLGSGVVIGAGEVVTNCHVLKGSDLAEVKYRQREYLGELKHADFERDVCSLTVLGLRAPLAALGSTQSLKVGQKVFAIGAPKGLELTLSEGIISSLREVAGGRYLQISAPISPGSSGGGLFDEDGRLIGLPTFYLSQGQQLNFAVPVEWITELPKRQVAAKAGSSGVASLDRAIELESQKDWPGLLRHAKAWTEAEPGEFFAWLSLGSAYRNNRKPGKAIEALKRALVIVPESPEAWYELGLAYIDHNQADEGMEAYRQALRIDPDKADVWNELGDVYFLKNRNSKAIEAYKEAVRVDPKHASAWAGLGLGSFNAGLIADAIKAYEQSLFIDPDLAGRWFSLGRAYKAGGDRAKMMEVYKRLKIMDPKLADVFFETVVLP